MLSILHQVVGGTFVAAGIVLFPLPIPLGWLFLLTGVALLVPYNPATQQLVKSIRRRWPAFDRGVLRFKAKAPKFIQVAIEKTNPWENA
ncbi:MAG: PGPGW domain-containing protein [Pseudomonadota bacterium]